MNVLEIINVFNFVKKKAYILLLLQIPFPKITPNISASAGLSEERSHNFNAMHEISLQKGFFEEMTFRL